MSGIFRYGSANCGGIVGHVKSGATLCLYNSLFNGQFTMAKDYGKGFWTNDREPVDCAPFVGLNEGTLNLQNCYFSGKANTWGYKCSLFVGKTAENATTNIINNFYYKDLYGLTNQANSIDASTMTTKQLDEMLGSQWKMTSDKTTVVPCKLLTLQGEGTEESPYIINNELDWRCFIYYTTLGDGYDQKEWRQTNSITTTKWGAILKGAAEDGFATYDGYNNTLTFDVESNQQYVSPFTLAEKANIKNLKVAGKLKGGIHSSGLVGLCGQTVNITNCAVEADITFGNTSITNAHGAGMVGNVHNATLSMQDCLFTGKLTANGNSVQGGTWAGAFVGWGDQNASVTFTNCTELGTFDATVDHADFIYRNIAGNENSGGTLVNCYNMNGQKQDAQLTKVYPSREGSCISRANATPIAEYGNFGVKGCSMELENNITINYLTYNNRAYVPKGFLIDDDDNTEFIKLNQTSGSETTDITLYGRRLYEDGCWNTICLPFALSADQLNAEDCPLKDATIMALGTSDFADGTLTLNFVTVNAIDAGKPYIVKWKSGYDIDEPLFKGVSIAGGEPSSTTTNYVDFVGLYSPFQMKTNDHAVLFLDDANKLYYPLADVTINAFRGYFKLHNIDQLDASRIVLNFGDEATSISDVTRQNNQNNAWYTLDGRKLDGEPTQKGIYIHNGKKQIFLK